MGGVGEQGRCFEGDSVLYEACDVIDDGGSVLGKTWECEGSGTRGEWCMGEAQELR